MMRATARRTKCGTLWHWLARPAVQCVPVLGSPGTDAVYCTNLAGALRASALLDACPFVNPSALFMLLQESLLVSRLVVLRRRGLHGEVSAPDPVAEASRLTKLALIARSCCMDPVECVPHFVCFIRAVCAQLYGSVVANAPRRIVSRIALRISSLSIPLPCNHRVSCTAGVFFSFR